jgi:hypothetical protein
VQTDSHHAAMASAAFFYEILESIFEMLTKLISRRETAWREKFHIVLTQGVGDNEMWLLIAVVHAPIWQVIRI